MKTVLLEVQRLSQDPNHPVISSTLCRVGQEVQKLVSCAQKLEDELRVLRLETIELEASKLRLERSIKHEVERERKEDKIRLALLQRIVTWGIEVDRPGSSMSVLHEACLHGLLDIVEILVAKEFPLGVMEEVRGAWGNHATPIHLAIYQGHCHVVQYLHKQDDTLIHRLAPTISSAELAALAGPEMLKLVLDLLKSSGADESEHEHSYYAVAACATGDTQLLEEHLEFVPEGFSMSGGIKLTHAAAQYLQLDVLKHLAARKLDLFALSDEGGSVFYFASLAVPNHFLDKHRSEWQIAKGNLFEFNEEAESNRRILEVISWLVAKAHSADFGTPNQKRISTLKPSKRKLFQLYGMDMYHSCVIRGAAYLNFVEVCIELCNVFSRVFDKCDELKLNATKSATTKFDEDAPESIELNATHMALGKLLENVKATIVPFAWKSKKLLKWLKTDVKANMSAVDIWSRTVYHHAAEVGQLDTEFLRIVELTKEQARQKDWASMSVADLAVFFGDRKQISLLLEEGLVEPSVALAGKAAYFGHRHLFGLVSPNPNRSRSDILLEHLKCEARTLAKTKLPGPSWWKLLKTIDRVGGEEHQTVLIITGIVGNTKWLKRANVSNMKMPERQTLLDSALATGQWSFISALPGQNLFPWFGFQSGIDISSLWRAAIAGHFAVFTKIRGMLTVGTDLRQRSTGGYHIMHYAARGGNYRIVKWLLKNGFGDLIETYPSPLLDAACQRDVRVIELVSTSNTIYNIQDELKRTPAHYAAEKGSLPVLTFLKSKDADFVILDKKGRLPSHLAALAGQLQALQYILDHVRLEHIWKEDSEGNNIAHLAFSAGHSEVIKWIASTKRLRDAFKEHHKLAQTNRNTFFNYPQNKHGHAPFQLASELLQQDITRWLASQ